MTLNEMVLAAAIAIIAMIAGFVYVWRAAQRKRQSQPSNFRNEYHRDELLWRAIGGAPAAALLGLVCLLFILGLFNAVPGTGIGGALMAGVATILVYGLSFAIVVIPFAIIGGLVALLVNSRRK